ncbi:hypothetical protein [Botrimarina mediterranea]|uniref:Uncharacterized protein n=1 Tax=Botrimarina mediterranea TaxID=2528022 RepID=A0A518KCC0_9BACT|nr:hypothetical protein [Botrimarina mediterranea]QDV75399.1 hypothetical protein Spa11_36160 [Botrimarina mediterranea]
MSNSREWLGAYKAPASALLCAVRAALVAHAADGAPVTLEATERGARIGARDVAEAPDALAFGAVVLPYAAAQALALWLAGRGADLVSVARLAGAVQLSAHGADAWLVVACDAAAAAEPPRGRLQALQAEARRLGVRWSDVRALAAELAERDGAAELDALRRRVAELFGRQRSAWRRNVRLMAQRLDRSDLDSAALAGWDCAAATLREEFPQYAGLDSAALFDLATSDNAPPSACDYLAEALGWIEAHAALAAAADDLDAVPF